MLDKYSSVSLKACWSVQSLVEGSAFWHHYTVCNSILCPPRQTYCHTFPVQMGHGRWNKRQDSSSDAERQAAAAWERQTCGGPVWGIDFYKRQINHPADSRFLCWCSSHLISFNIPLFPYFTRVFKLGGFGPVTQTTLCIRQKSRQSRRLSFIDDSCQDVLFFLFGGDKSKA